ncbi:HD domain-containing protein [Pedococcus soli]
MNPDTTVGTHAWTVRTGGHLQPPETRRLLLDLARTHATNAVGRLTRLVHLHPGRIAWVDPMRLVPPTSALTRAATDAATNVLPAPLLNHSMRTYQFGKAIGELEGVDVDAELLYAAALLHDTGLVTATGRDDFTLTSARLALDVAEQVGLSTAATNTLQTAITMHHNPRVPLTAGPVAYLLAAGAAADVAGVRTWQLPTAVLTATVRNHPRDGFKKYFTHAWANEAARVPDGRARLLCRHGAFTAAITLAPFND